MREIGFDRVNTAAYSPRPNTPAAEWENQVADLIKQDRLNRWAGGRVIGAHVVRGVGLRTARRAHRLNKRLWMSTSESALSP